jgi:hypothetical protein
MGVTARIVIRPPGELKLFEPFFSAGLRESFAECVPSTIAD